MERRFDGLSMEHIRRARNIAADALSQMAARRTPIPPGVFLERLTKPSIPIALPEPEEVPGIPRETLPGTHGLPDAPLPAETPAPQGPVLGKHVVAVVESSIPLWASDIHRFLKHKYLPDDVQAAERVARQAKLYTLIDGELYRRRENGVKLPCIPEEEGRGSCGRYTRGCVPAMWRRGL